MFFVSKVPFGKYYSKVETWDNVLRYCGYIGSVFTPRHFDITLKMRLMSHKLLVLRRISLFNALSHERNKMITSPESIYFLFTVMLGTVYLTDPCVHFICILLIGHRDHKIYNSWNRVISTTTASWHLTWHFSNDCGNFPAHLFIVKLIMKLQKYQSK